jgi:Na+-transporting methylmalonyl-CoA/oxaloacetate decarboxylase gamma subunit
MTFCQLPFSPGGAIFNLTVSTLITVIAMGLTFVSLAIIILGAWLIGRFSPGPSDDRETEALDLGGTREAGEIIAVIGAAVDRYRQEQQISYARGFPGERIWHTSSWRKTNGQDYKNVMRRR